MTAELSGVDLARVALANARAAAKTAPRQAPRKRTGARVARGGREPLAFGDALMRMMAERGWEAGVGGGSILDQWPTIAPELAGKVAAERFDETTGTLSLRPGSPAYATQLRLHQRQVLARIQAAPGGTAVKAVDILPVGNLAPTTAAADDVLPKPAVAPVPEDRAPTAGYLRALAVHRDHHRPPAGVVDLTEQIARARARQEAALRAHRLPDEDGAEYRANVEGQRPEQASKSA